MRPANPSLSLAERIDAACDRFESEWKAGRRPRIDEYLAAAPEADREQLRTALLGVERELAGRGATDTSVSRSSVRSQDKRSPDVTAAYPGDSQQAPATIGRFQIRSVLGSGAFGKVYRAFDPQLGREVALKVPLESAVKTDAERSQFLREARAAATINHPNICQIHEVGEHDGRPYIVMALVPGKSLADVLKARKAPPSQMQIALIVRKLAHALAAAHKKGVVHRDLKPANVMFDRERKDIVVMDFGLARGPRLGDARATQSGIIMGTPAYMSPEQARGESKDVGPAGDIFSLGVILYELLTGTRPFTGTATEVIGQILHVEPEPPSKRRPDIDRRLEVICLKAMAKEPAQRYATMQEVTAALDVFLRASSAETAKADKTRQDAQPAGTETMAEVFAALTADRKQARAETAALMEEALRKHRTPRWLFVVLALAFVGGVAVLGGIVFFTRSDKVKVTIELTDVDLADKTLSFFLDDEPISAEALAQPIELKPGEHVLVVKRGKTIVKRMLLTVAGGRSPGLKVKDITPPPKEDKKLSPEEEDRAFAEWLISIGVKSVTTAVEGGPQKVIGKRADLPREPFRVTSFDAWGNNKINDRTVDPILRWIERRKIDEVSFFGTAIGDDTVRRLVQLASLKKIYLGATKITSACIPVLASRTDLVNLNIQERPISDKDLEKLGGLVNLEGLSLDRTLVTDAGLKHLRIMKKLRILVLHSTAVTGAGLDELAGLPIEGLGLNSTKVRGAKDLAPLKKLPELKEVDLATLLLRDDDLKPLVQCKSIEILELHGNRITDAGLETLAEMKWLKHVRLSLYQSGNLVTPAGVAKLRKALPGCNVIYDPPSGTDPKRAAALQLLTSGARVDMRVGDRPMSVSDPSKLPAEPFVVIGVDMDERKGADTLLALVKKHFPDIEGVSFAQTDVTIAGMEHLRGLNKLKDVFCEGIAIDDRGFAVLAELKDLRSLWIAFTQLGNEGARVLAGLPELRYIRANYTRIDDEGLSALKKAPKLESIEVPGNAVTDVGLAHLKHYPALKGINLAGTKITDAGLAHLEQVKKLENLRLDQTAITDAGVVHLAKCTQLKRLFLVGTKMTAQGLADLRKALPECEIVSQSKP